MQYESRHRTRAPRPGPCAGCGLLGAEASGRGTGGAVGRIALYWLQPLGGCARSQAGLVETVMGDPR